MGALLVSVVICTSDRAASLARTLKALGDVDVPSDWRAEVVIVDNGSTDDTATVTRETALPKMTKRYVHEGKKGLSRARNAGLANAAGEVILFTDDDALPAKNWIDGMLVALEAGGYDAVTGRFAVARSLERPWLTPMHMWWLGSSDHARPHDGVQELIGGNMGFRRSVLGRVPKFDSELGAGALGFGDDTLFGWQLAEAGFRIGYAPAALVIHDADPSRLKRKHWIDAARKRGRSAAYLTYHWEHRNIPFPQFMRIVYMTKLRLRRSLRRAQPLEREGCPLWEMSYILQMEKNRQFCIEKDQARHYSLRGLVKHVGQV